MQSAWQLRAIAIARAGGRGFDAVRGVTFSVRRGELFALLGTNGAGKTSAMEVLEGLALPARGAVRVLGCDPWRERADVQARGRRTEQPGSARLIW